MQQHTLVIHCPHCWEPTETEADPRVSHVVFVEDCPVCCNPMRIEVWSPEDEEPACQVSSANE